MIRRHAGTTLFPYTTLFRSGIGSADRECLGVAVGVTRLDPAGVHGRVLGDWRIDVDIFEAREVDRAPDRKSTRLNSSHMSISYAVFCLKKKNGSGAVSIHLS